ncbi:MAG: hypothetical protein ANABAC_2316 [Anaerolineae bacterium]|nr:MAG: hypothetical protein ANABAC_2316 [Anaerolineae bacterium]
MKIRKLPLPIQHSRGEESICIPSPWENFQGWFAREGFGAS